MSMLRTIKPKNARVKRALEKREPQLVENEKTAIFVRGQNTSEKVRTAMKELYALKRPNAINFSRKNDIHPFEDASSLEFFASKNDAALFVTGLHSKKRPNDLVFSRTFDGRIFDQFELGVEDVREMASYATPKASLGSRPLITFHSDLFDTHPLYIQLKSHLLDFYNGYSLPEIPITAIEHVISITAGPLPPDYNQDATNPTSTSKLPRVHFRVYTLKVLSVSSTKQPKLELTEMGPSIDWSIRRVQEADGEMMRQASKRPKIAKKDVESGLGKKKKNIETDIMGDRVGRIHLGKQDLGKVQGRKVRALGRGLGKKEKSGSAGEKVDVEVTED